MATRGIFCHDLPLYKTEDGGYFSTTLTNELFSRYFEVVDELIVATRVYPVSENDVAGQEEVNYPGLIFLDLPNVNARSAPFRELPAARKMLLEAISTSDLIFIRGGMVARLGVDISKKLGKSYLLESSGCAWDSYWHHGIVGKIIAPYMEYRERKDIEEADFVIYVTEKWLQSRYPTKGQSTFASNVIVDCGYDCEAVLSRRIKRDETLKKSERFAIGTLANTDVRYKGHEYVIKAMARLKERVDCDYYLVGGGRGDRLRRLARKYGIEDRLHFLGELSHSEVLNWLDEVDIYVQPSLQEGLPRALIEAMSRGCLCIGSRIAGIPELLEPEEMFAKGSVSELCSILSSIIDSDTVKIRKRNIEKSKKYDKYILQERRRRIYQDYLASIVGRGEAR